MEQLLEPFTMQGHTCNLNFYGFNHKCVLTGEVGERGVRQSNHVTWVVGLSIDFWLG